MNLSEEVRVHLKAAAEGVDIDSLAEKLAAAVENAVPRKCQHPDLPYIFVALFVVGAFFGGLLVSFSGQGSAAPTKIVPYHQAYFSQLRYDSRTICAAAAAQDALSQDNQDWSAWQSAVNAYIGDQRILENARHIITPNYQDMANVVCPQ